MKKQLLFEEDYDFSLLGIGSHVKDYRLCWEINKAMRIELEKMDGEMELEEEDVMSVSSYFNEETHMQFTLITNKFDGGMWFPELPQLDYFMKISGPQHEEEAVDCKQVLQGIDAVLTVLTINPLELKSKINLVF